MISGFTPAHIAAAKEDPEVIRELIRWKASLHIKDFCGLTPLHIAALFKNCDVINQLIDNGADVNATDEDHATPLFFALVEDNMAVCEQLLNSGADPDIALTVTPERLDGLFPNDNEPSLISQLNELKQAQLNEGKSLITITPYQIAQMFKNSRGIALIDQHKKQLKLIKEAGKRFFTLVAKLETLCEELAEKMDAYPVKYTHIHDKVQYLYVHLLTQGTLFFNAPNSRDLKKLRAMNELIESTKKVAQEHRGLWYQLNPLLRSILGVLCALTFLPMLAIAYSLKEGFAGTFFARPRTSSEKVLDEVQKEMELELRSVTISPAPQIAQPLP